VAKHEPRIFLYPERGGGKMADLATPEVMAVPRWLDGSQPGGARVRIAVKGATRKDALRKWAHPLNAWKELIDGDGRQERNPKRKREDSASLGPVRKRSAGAATVTVTVLFEPSPVLALSDT
jgi:hypothetical protein